MKVLAIIASVIMIVFPTVSFILALVAAKKKTYTRRGYILLEVIPGTLMWLATLAVYYFAGVFRNFGL